MTRPTLNPRKRLVCNLVAALSIVGLASESGCGTPSQPSDGGGKVSWNMLFGTTGSNLDVSACTLAIPAGWCAQVVKVDSTGAFHEVWSEREPNVMRVDGTLTATSVSATLTCVATSSSGSLSATANGAEYTGTATLGGKSISLRVVKGSGSPQPPCSGPQ